MLNYHEQRKRKEFLERLSKIYRTSPNSIVNLLKRELKTCFRINTLKSSYKKTLLGLKSEGFISSPIEWCPNAYILNSRSKFELSKSKYFREGYIYIQNASSFIPPLALNPQKGDLILDVCAAPGGKAIQIADLSKNEIKLWVNDPMKPRHRILLQLLQRYKVDIYNATMYRGEDISSKIDIQFDKILIDAQCSGEGMINLKKPRAMRHWSLKRIFKFHKQQKHFLENGYKLLKPGGVLVYTTCTFAPEENECSIDYILKKHDDLSIEKINLQLSNFSPGIISWKGKKLKPEIVNCIRILPNELMEGFFICKLRKNNYSVCPKS